VIFGGHRRREGWAQQHTEEQDMPDPSRARARLLGVSAVHFDSMPRACEAYGPSQNRRKYCCVLDTQCQDAGVWPAQLFLGS